jgi:hypothetical protein
MTILKIILVNYVNFYFKCILDHFVLFLFNLWLFAGRPFPLDHDDDVVRRSKFFLHSDHPNQSQRSLVGLLWSSNWEAAKHFGSDLHTQK